LSYEKLFDKFLSFIVKVVFKMQVGKDKNVEEDTIFMELLILAL